MHGYSYKICKHNYSDDVIVKDKNGVTLGKGTFVCGGMSITLVLLNKVVKMLHIYSKCYIWKNIAGKELLY